MLNLQGHMGTGDLALAGCGMGTDTGRATLCMYENRTEQGKGTMAGTS